MHPLPSRVRAQIRRLVRRYRLKLVAEVFGMTPGQLARLQAGERCQETTRQSVAEAFSDLGAELGLDTFPEQWDRTMLDPLPGEPRLQLVRDRTETPHSGRGPDHS
jgi:hypothetical protein